MIKKRSEVILLTGAEIQSNNNRVNWAEGLILQLPNEHEGRNSWLLNYGIGIEADMLRQKNKLKWNSKTQSCETSKV